MTPPRRAMVTRRVFALVVVLFVVMMGASDVAIILEAPQGPSATDVKRDIQAELNRRAALRDQQTCSILATLPHTRRSDQVRHSLRCYQALPPTASKRPGTTPSGVPRVVVVPTPGPTATATTTIIRTARPTSRHPGSRTPSPSCTTTQVWTRCVAPPPVPTPTLRLR